MKPIVAIVGPTASGKTQVSIELAKRLQGEIVSADSMLIYKHMDIGTAKPDVAERQGIPHHLIDMIEPWQDFSVSDYQIAALQTVTDILQRKQLPLLVGGTGLYIRAVTEEYQFSPGEADTEFREQCAKLAQQRGNDYLRQRLWQVDPESADRLHPNDLRRIIRALEVYHQTGRPLSNFYRKGRPRYDSVIIGLTAPRDVLYRRIHDRVDVMMRQGLVDEVQSLLQQGVNRQCQSMQAIGYKEITAYLAGECSLNEAVDKIKIGTRHYAKRQLTWFRRMPEIVWFDITDQKIYLLMEYIYKYIAGKLYLK